MCEHGHDAGAQHQLDGFARLVELARQISLRAFCEVLVEGGLVIGYRAVTNEHCREVRTTDLRSRPPGLGLYLFEGDGDAELVQALHDLDVAISTRLLQLCERRRERVLLLRDEVTEEVHRRPPLGLEPKLL